MRVDLEPTMDLPTSLRKREGGGGSRTGWGVRGLAGSGVAAKVEASGDRAEQPRK